MILTYLGNKGKGILKNCKDQASGLQHGTWNSQYENVKSNGDYSNFIYVRAEHYLSGM